MIKGYQKNIIVIKDTNSEIFEKAIFIIKKEIPTLSDYTLTKEAQRIIDENIIKPQSLLHKIKKK